ncbi:MAG: right-handed parallel beta-helix repeat-containing protein [Phycisphaerae bacterium]|nr:right-handed parallel beta-helix repeat-containing protein [Phycisphaerae bacterium]
MQSTCRLSGSFWTRILVRQILAVLLVGGFGSVAGAAEVAKPKAPAAVIDAGKFPDLQAALNAVPEGGGLVKLPPGRFELTKPLLLEREDTRVEGCGAATHLINKSEKGEPALILRHKDRAKDKKAHAWRVQLADFRVSGNPKSGDGVLAEGINEVYVSGLSVDHNGGHGINLIDCYEDPRISDSIITYNVKAGLNIIGGHDIVVNANQFEENQDAVRCIDCYNLCMNGNNIDDHLRDGVVIENTYGSVLSGNMIEECRGIAVIMDRDCYGNTISANVIAHNEGGGVDLRDAHGCAVSANTFVLNYVRGIVVGPEAGRITITGNNFCNSYIGKGIKRRKDDDAGEGVLLKGTNDIAITGNVFSGMAREAIRAEGQCKRIVIVGNTVVETSKSAPGKFKAFDLPEAEMEMHNNTVAP